MVFSTITIPYTLLVPSSLGGKQDQQLYDLAVFARTAGADAVTVGDNTEYLISQDKLSIGIVKLIVSKGGDVFDYPMWVKIQDKTQEVPEGLPNRTYIDKEEQKAHTWESWTPSTHTILEGTDGNLYVGCTDGILHYKASQLVSVLDVLVDKQHILEITPTKEDE